MMGTAELGHLTRWCASRHLSWQPAVTALGEPAVLLTRRMGFASGEHRLTLLVADDDGFRLLDGQDELLAEGSSLAGLLDAIDAGLCEARRPQGLPAVAVLLWNNPGSASTYP